MIPLRNRWNTHEIEDFFENLFATIDANIAYLTSHIIASYFDEYDKQIQQSICNIHGNYPDSINHATAIKYNTEHATLTLVTTDKNDYRIGNLAKKLSDQGVQCSEISLPEILYLPDYSP